MPAYLPVALAGPHAGGEHGRNRVIGLAGNTATLTRHRDQFGQCPYQIAYDRTPRGTYVIERLGALWQCAFQRKVIASDMTITTKRLIEREA